ncbi:MAG: hypothetical protein NT080_03785 [Spirochaetes bacterium]|nr:hypothetical protein [Spirochaetota bacterium]
MTSVSGWISVVSFEPAKSGGIRGSCHSCRRQRGWKVARAFDLGTAVFLVVIFAFFGVNLLLVGLHGYA